MLEIDRLHILFSVNEETGELIREVDKGPRARKGKVVGTKDRQGYLNVYVEGNNYKVHRIVFAMYHGRWPIGSIDHINGIVNDNRISNLRECNHSQNAANTPFRGNSSGYRGVYWHKEGKKWCARITTKGKTRHLGLFLTKEEASLAYETEANKMWPTYRDRHERNS